MKPLQLMGARGERQRARQTEAAALWRESTGRETDRNEKTRTQLKDWKEIRELPGYAVAMDTGEPVHCSVGPCDSLDCVLMGSVMHRGPRTNTHTHNHTLITQIHTLTTTH